MEDHGDCLKIRLKHNHHVEATVSIFEEPDRFYRWCRYGSDGVKVLYPCDKWEEVPEEPIWERVEVQISGAAPCQQTVWTKCFGEELANLPDGHRWVAKVVYEMPEGHIMESYRTEYQTTALFIEKKEGHDHRP